MPEFKVYLHDAKTNHPYRLDDIEADDEVKASALAVGWMKAAFGVEGDEDWTVDKVVQVDA